MTQPLNNPTFERLSLQISRIGVQITRLRRLFDQASAQLGAQLRQQSEATFAQIDEELRITGERADEIRNRMERFPELVNAITLMNASLEPEAVLEDVMDTVIALTGTERAYLMLIEGGELHVKIARNWDQATVDENEISVSRGVVELAFETREVVFTANAQNDVRFQGRTSIHKQGVYSIVCIPLLLRGEIMGVLYTDNRNNLGQFNADGLPLLRTFANQAATAIDTARLFAQLRATAQALQQSREQLVETREEERRRLRRDLHDGLGAALAGITLGLDAARGILNTDPAQAESLLVDLKADVRNTLNDVRRLIYDLRPPSLDELGLVGALQGFVRGLHTNGSGNTTHVRFVQPEVPEMFTPLSAAIEVALYRIATEAVTNVIRHAQAGECIVMLSFQEESREIFLEIRDNGRGFQENGHIGVGLMSMRERAEELGGKLYIESPVEGRGGARVVAILPVG